MGVRQIMMLLPQRPDGSLGGDIVAAAAPEDGLDLLQQRLRYLVGAGLLQLLHQSRHQSGIAAEQIQQPLQIAGHQNVHGGGNGLIEGAVAVIAAGAQELCQHVVGVGGADEPSHRQAQLPGKKACQNIAEIAGGHGEIHLVAHGDAAGAAQVRVGTEIVHHLRGQPADIDGVGGGETHLLPLQQLLLLHGGKDLLYAGLSVVKVAADGAHADVAALLGLHLPLLHGADAAVGIEHDDLRAGYITKALHGGLAGVAAGGGQDQDLVVHAALFPGGGHQPGQHTQRHILEGAGGAAEQLQHRIIAHRNGGGQLRRLELAVVGGADKGVHLLFGKRGQQRRQNFAGHGQGIHLQCRLPVQPDPGQRRHGVQSAVGGKALQNSLGGCGVESGVSRALIVHRG